MHGRSRRGGAGGTRRARAALGPAPKLRYLAGRVKGWPVGLLCWIFTHMPSWLTDNLM